LTDFLDQKRQEIQARLKELKPLVDEYQRLEAADRALSGVNDAPARSTSTATRRTRRTSGGGSGRRGRPRGSGTRSAQALALVQAKPGITIPEMGKEMESPQTTCTAATRTGQGRQGQKARQRLGTRP
jgi:hypothetical protein